MIGEIRLQKSDIRYIDSYHQSVAQGQKVRVSHVRSPLGGKRYSLYCHRVEYILRCGKPSRGLDMIVVPAEQKVGSKIEVLLAAVAGKYPEDR